MFDNKNTPSERETGVCIAVIGSVTNAMGAQKALAMAAVRSNVLKVNSAKSGVGCAYGVSFVCSQSENVHQILRSAGIRVKKYIKD